ncbi:ABC transporter ATP-binding protein [Flammeovirgaceae bacterium SG7u.111]|nr:ABC transporter ATP-binding protein [Flammeovirgaceae bacterium SG7u.132]WPO33161.1 ABC transporter ATP-binding protein [Flammeovirgaceae bacterium SG7u.111]
MIHIKNLHFQYPSGEFSLHIEDFELKKAEKVAIIGPSGSGKTTLLNLISGIFPTEKGAVEVAEQPVHQLNDQARRDFRISNIGFVFQDFELLDYLNVFGNILHPYRITKALKLSSEVKERAKLLARQMGISDKLSRKPSELSQGEKQRTAICRALLPKPKLILADEATGNLDPVNKTRILDLLFDAVEKENATLLAVTHDHELLPRFDRVFDFNTFTKSSNS